MCAWGLVGSKMPKILRTYYVQYSCNSTEILSRSSECFGMCTCRRRNKALLLQEIVFIPLPFIIWLGHWFSRHAAKGRGGLHKYVHRILASVICKINDVI